MLNSVATGRRLMVRAAVYPLVAVAIASALSLLLGVKFACGVALTGLAVTLGGWVAARTALSGGVQGAGIALLRLILALGLKVVLVIAALALGFALWGLPPLALLAGVVVGLISQALAMLAGH